MTATKSDLINAVAEEKGKRGEARAESCNR